MLRTLALTWPLLGSFRRAEVVARIAWLLTRQVLWLFVTLSSALLAATFALAPVAALMDAARGAAAALLFVPMAIFGAVFFLVGRAGLRRLVGRHVDASRQLALRLTDLGAGHAVGGRGHSSAAVGTRMILRIPLPRARRARPSVWVTFLLVAASLLGVLGALSVHSMRGFHCKAKQAEARSALKAIYVTEMAWNADKGTWLDLEGLVQEGGLDARTVRGKYYNFRVEARADGFRAFAVDSVTPVRHDRAFHDVWTIDQTSPSPLRVSNACD